MTNRFAIATLVAGTLSLVGASASAVESEHRFGDPSVLATADGTNSLRDLEPSLNFGLDTGYNLGAGVALPLGDDVAVRASYAFSRAESEAVSGVPIATQEFDRHYVGADLQLKPSFGSDSVRPFLSAGLGFVNVSAPQPLGSFRDHDFTKPAGRFGVGLEYLPPRSPFGLYTEAAGWLYDWDGFGLERTQFDANWVAGLSYRF
jgi:opacity protein-like surface antigen